MLERLSVGQNVGRSQKSMLQAMMGNKKSASYHVVISQLRAELMGAKQHAPGHPCVLLWVRGDTTHVTEDSVGQTVLSWSDTYFAQLVTLVPSSGGGFRPKECKFKVQQKGKTIAKTALVDLAKYCSDAGLAREQTVKVPLQPSGTLYFVVSTAPAAEHAESAKSCTSAMSECHTSNGNGAQLAASSVGVGAASLASAASSAMATPIGATGAAQNTPRNSVFSLGSSQQGVAAALAGSASAGPGPGSVGAAPSEDGDRPSTSGRLQKKHRLQNTVSASKPLLDGEGSGFFRRIARVGSKGAGAGAGAAAAATAAGVSSGGGSSVAHLPMRKYDSAEFASGGGGGGGGSPSGIAAAAARMAAGSAGSVGAIAGLYSPARRVGGLRSCNGGLTAAASAPQCPGAGGGDVARQSVTAASTSSSSDAAVAGAAGAAASPKRAGGGGAAAAATADGGGGGGGGWGAWLRGGLSWGRNSNHSATGTSTTGALSQASLHGPGGAAGGGEHDSSALEAAIMEASEPAELRDLALDMLHERDEWRSRALSAQDALGRAQTARASAVRESQRLEVRLREYKDELGRGTDGSLLQELVEAKVRIAELANENLRLRRQITHMGPLFYDSGDEGHGVTAG